MVLLTALPKSGASVLGSPFRARAAHIMALGPIWTTQLADHLSPTLRNLV